MRRKDREILDSGRIEEIINETDVVRLGLSFEDRPYIVPMNFAYQDRKVYLHSAANGRKIDVLGKNPNVCLEFDIPGHYCDDDSLCNAGFTYRSVIGFGRARFLETTLEKNRALSLITEKYSRRKQVYSPEKLANVIVIEVDIDSLTAKEK